MIMAGETEVVTAATETSSLWAGSWVSEALS